jgi:thioredoxin-dependent peroxiredoxin
MGEPRAFDLGHSRGVPHQAHDSTLGGYSGGMTRLAAGDTAPPFELLDQHDNRVRLQDFRGGKLLVYFYPEADTPGCTTQSCSIRDHRQDLAGIGADVVGISPDQPDKQLAFDKKYGLGFPLLSDPDHAIADAWGTWGEKSRNGRTYQGIIRSSFLVDQDGRIERAWYSVKPEDTVPNAIEALRT